MRCLTVEARNTLGGLGEAVDVLDAAAVECMVASKDSNDRGSGGIVGGAPMSLKREVELAERAPCSQRLCLWRFVVFKQS